MKALLSRAGKSPIHAAAIAAAMFAVLASSLVSCDNQRLLEGLLAMEQTTLVLELEPPQGSRTIYPDFDLGVAAYDISGIGPGGAEFSVLGYPSALYSRTGLEPGEWVISATAKNAEGEVLGGSPAVTVNLAKAKTVQARLTCAAPGGEGFYTLRISWPAGLVSAPEPAADLISRTGERYSVSFAKAYSSAEAAGSRRLPKGFYSLEARISDGRFGFGMLWRGLEELYIAEAATTRCEFPLTAAELNLEPGSRTFAGSGSAGSLNGLGAAASFNAPGDIVMGTNGNLYVADTASNRIRMITPDGVVSTFAGGGGAGVRQAGFIDGMMTEAAFNEPSAIAVEPNGNLLVADSGNHAIRRITPVGQVQTIVGNGTPGDAEGTANTSGLNGTARLNYPCGVASSGTYIYIADSNNNKIRRAYLPGDQVITYAGSGTAAWADGVGTAASFKFPAGLALAPGALFVADTQNHRVRRIETATSSATVSTLAGNSTPGSADGVGASASFRFPRGLAASDSGYLYVADSMNHKIRRVTIEGQATTTAGSGFSGWQDGPGLENAFSSPKGLAAGSQGKVYVADTWNNRIRLLLTR